MENNEKNYQDLDRNYQELYNKYKKKYKILLEKLNSSKNWKLGDTLIYKKTNEKVELIKIHYDDITPYYTIKMPDNREKQTTIDKLISIK